MIDFNSVSPQLPESSDSVLATIAHKFGIQSIPAGDPGPFDLSRLKTGAEIFQGDYVISWIWDKMIPEGAVILFYAQGGSGKSTIVSQLADAVSQGAPFMGLQTQQRPVVIVDYENPLGVLKGRIAAVNSETSVMFWTLTDEPPQLDKPEWESFVALVGTLKNPLMIFDTLQSATSDLDVTSNKDYSPVMRKLKQLRELGATIVLLHHTPKADATKYVGASVIFNQVDHVLAQYPVRQSGTDAEAADDETAHVYRFGTRDKTRYGHHKIYVKFDEDKKVFVESDGPDQDAIDILKRVIGERSPINQSALLADTSVSCLMSQAKAKALLKSFTGIYWTAEKREKNATVYAPIQFVSFSHPRGVKTEKQKSDDADPLEKQGTPDNSQRPINSEFVSLPEWARKTEKLPQTENRQLESEGEVRLWSH